MNFINFLESSENFTKFEYIISSINQKLVTEDIVVLCNLTAFITLYVYSRKMVSDTLSQEIEIIGNESRYVFNLKEAYLLKINEYLNYYENQLKWNSFIFTFSLFIKKQRKNYLFLYSNNITYLLQKNILNELNLQFKNVKLAIIKDKLKKLLGWNNRLTIEVLNLKNIKYYYYLNNNMNISFSVYLLFLINIAKKNNITKSLLTFFFYSKYYTLFFSKYFTKFKIINIRTNIINSYKKLRLLHLNIIKKHKFLLLSKLFNNSQVAFYYIYIK